MLLKGTHVVQLGCGLTGDIAGQLLTRLGAGVTRMTLSPCPTCGDLCDESEPWRAGYSKAKTNVTISPDELPGWAATGDSKRIDAALIDGVTGPILDSWAAIARTRRIPSFLFVTVGDEQPDIEIEASGLGAEAVAGVAGTMGPADGAPTPFGYVFGESNAAIRGVAMLVDRLVNGLLQPSDPANDEWLVEVSAADACIDAMDDPWQETTMPAAIHEAPNSLTNANYRRTGAQKVGIVPYGLLQARDGWVCLVGASTMEPIAEALGRPELLEDERLATLDARIANRDYVIGIFQEWVGTFERGQDFVDLLGNSVVVAKSERLEDILDDPHGLLGFDQATAPYAITVGGVPVEDLDA